MTQIGRAMRVVVGRARTGMGVRMRGMTCRLAVEVAKGSTVAKADESEDREKATKAARR